MSRIRGRIWTGAPENDPQAVFSSPQSAGGDDEGSLAFKAMPFWAKLTQFDGGHYYAWTEQQFTPDGGNFGSGVPGFQDLPGGRFGTVTSDPAREPNGVVLSVPSFVRLQHVYFDPVVSWVFLVVSESAITGLEVMSDLGTPDFTGIIDLELQGMTAATLTQPASGKAKVGVFGASGVSHGTGLVVDPGSTQNHPKRFLREDATWHTTFHPNNGVITPGVSTTVPKGGIMTAVNGLGMTITDPGDYVIGGMFDWQIASVWTPSANQYVGLGLGITLNGVGGTNLNDTKTISAFSGLPVATGGHNSQVVRLMQGLLVGQVVGLEASWGVSPSAGEPSILAGGVNGTFWIAKVGPEPNG
jgi:hypothetical protein